MGKEERESKLGMTLEIHIPKILFNFLKKTSKSQYDECLSIKMLFKVTQQKVGNMNNPMTIKEGRKLTKSYIENASSESNPQTSKN